MSMSAVNPWLLLVLAGLFEVAWAVGLKPAQGFTRFWPSVWVLVTMALSIGLLTAAVRSLPIGSAYAVWTGIGAVGAAVLGVMLFGESSDWRRLLCIGLIVSGIIGLKLYSPAAP